MGRNHYIQRQAISWIPRSPPLPLSQSVSLSPSLLTPLPTPQTPAPNFGISIAPHDDFLKETVFT